MSQNIPAPTHHPERLSEVEAQILQALTEIRFGSVEVVIHDSRIVQIEKSEKFRFDTKRDA